MEQHRVNICRPPQERGGHRPERGKDKVMSEYVSLPPSQRTRNMLNAAIHSVMLRECLDRLSPADRAHIVNRLASDYACEPVSPPCRPRGYGGRQ
jgi:hypothetical protein